MSEDGWQVVSVRMRPNTYARVKETAAEDTRKMGDQIRYLLSLGLEVRNRKDELEKEAARRVAESMRGQASEGGPNDTGKHSNAVGDT